MSVALRTKTLIPKRPPRPSSAHLPSSKLRLTLFAPTGGRATPKEGLLISKDTFCRCSLNTGTRSGVLLIAKRCSVKPLSESWRVSEALVTKQPRMKLLTRILSLPTLSTNACATAILLFRKYHCGLGILAAQRSGNRLRAFLEEFAGGWSE